MDTKKSQSNEHERMAAVVNLLQLSGLYEKNPVVRSVCDYYLRTQKYKPLKDFLDRHPNLLAWAQRMAREREASIFPQLSLDQSRSISGPIMLGHVDRDSIQLCIGLKHLAEKILIIGQPGSGKTFLGTIILWQLLKLADRDFNILIFDRKRDYDCLIKYFPHFYLLRAKYIQFNMFEVPEDEDPLEYLTLMAHVFCEINYFKATSAPIIRKALFECHKKNREFKLIDILLEIDAYAKRKGLKGLGTSDVLSKITARFDNIMLNQGLNEGKGLPLEFFRNNDIIFDLTGYDQATAATFSEILIMKLFRYNQRHNIRNTLTTLEFCDEAYWKFRAPLRGETVSSMESIADRLRQAREWGIGGIYGTQSSTSVCDTLKETTPHVITFRTLAASIPETGKLLGLTQEQTEQILNLPTPGAAIARLANNPPLPPILFFVPPIQKYDKIITDEEIFEVNEPKLRELKKYYHPADEPLESEDINHLEKMVMDSIYKNPFIHYTSLREDLRSQVNPKWLKKTLRSLEDKGLIQPIQCVNSPNNKKAWFYPLTNYADQLFGFKKSKLTDPKFFKHSLYCNHVAKSIKLRDFKPFFEHTPNNHLNKMERIDVAFYDQKDRLIAFEITLSKDTFISNIYKCHHMKAHHIIIVTEYKSDIGDLETMITQHALSSDIKSKILFFPIASFIPIKSKKKGVKNER